MFRPQEKELRYFTATMLERHRDAVQYIGWRWEKVYRPETNELVAMLPLLDMIMKG
jgi:hypothetical protein